MNALGTIARTKDGGFILHYERDFARPPAALWAAITDPAILKNWLGTIEIEPKVGGAFNITFKDGNVMNGVIQKFEPERLIEYSWSEHYGLPQSVVRWSITPRAGGCKLTLTHILPPGCKAEDIISFGGGWHSFLDAVPKALDGESGLEIAYSEASWKPIEAKYTGVFNEAPTLAIDGALHEAADGGTELRFERRIDRPAARVWTALTDPKVLANWLGDVDLEPRVGGKYVLTFRESGFVMTGTITAFEPERVLEYTWLEQIEAPELPTSLARWEMSASGGGCRLTLTHRFPKGLARKEILPFLGGWEAFLDVLAAGADGAFMPYTANEPYMIQYRAKYP